MGPEFGSPFLPDAFPVCFSCVCVCGASSLLKELWGRSSVLPLWRSLSFLMRFLCVFLGVCGVFSLVEGVVGTEFCSPSLALPFLSVLFLFAFVCFVWCLLLFEGVLAPEKYNILYVYYFCYLFFKASAPPPRPRRRPPSERRIRKPAHGVCRCSAPSGRPASGTGAPLPYAPCGRARFF